MSTYRPVTTAIINELKQLLGEKNVITDADKLVVYSHDEVTDPHYHHAPEVVVFPASTEEVAEVLRLANRELISVVPRGAGTGLACGAVPLYGGIVLSLEKLNQIIKVDTENMYITVQAGVRTEEVQQTAKAAGLFYAGDPCSGDSCFIGGNAATNAGGNKAVKYGTTRHQIYEMEVVTPQGAITTLGGRLAKSSTGYNLDQLLIGSEGTLGIITQLTLKLIPLPQNSMDLLAVFTDIPTPIAMVSKIIKEVTTPTCIEFMDNTAIQSVENFLNEKLPHSDNGHYLIIQLEGNNIDELEDFAVAIDEICMANGALAVMMPDPQKIWRARKSAAEAFRHETLIHSNEDIVVPLDKLPLAMHTMADICEKHQAVTRFVSHAGDGNIHISILQGDIPEDRWQQKLADIHQDIFDFVYPLGGKLSGEHGIGYKKKDLMEKYTDPVQLEMMRAIKKALDPNNILNPGKIFDVK